VIELLTVHNLKMEVFKKGNNGVPVLILTGMGGSFDDWYEVTDELSKTHKVIMFHRPGLGNSELGNEERNTFRAATEISELLNSLHIKEKIIIVGHSYGGLCVQHFVKLYPEMVQGVVLVDSTSVDLHKLNELDLSFLKENTDEKLIETWMEYSNMTKDELQETLKPVLTERQQKLSLECQKRMLEYEVSPYLYRAIASELKNWDTDALAIKELGNFMDVPLIVIGRDPSFNLEVARKRDIPEWEMRQFEQVWQELIKDQVHLSSESEWVIAIGAGHSIYLERPDVVIEAVRKL
jgi:pimeloyl-ACP methyl ester carboxylesterase